MDHPQYLTWGLLPQPVFPYRGPLVTSAIGELCDGPFRSRRAAFRVSLGNEGWSAVVGGTGGDPNVTTLDFVNAMNASRLNSKEFSQLAGNNSALLGTDLATKLRNLISRQFRIAFPIEQNPDANNRVTLSDARDALGLQRPKISYDISEYTKQGFAAAYHLKNLIFRKLGAIDSRAFEQTLERYGVDPAYASTVFEQLSKLIQPLEQAVYGEFEQAARARLGNDELDQWPVVAAALAFGDAIWAHDEGFFGVGIPVWTTHTVEIYLK